MERRIELEGPTNFRDLGGYDTVDGRTVKWRTVFRSDTLAALTERDIETLCELGITTACDLRYGDERVREPSRFLDHDTVEVLSLGLDERPSASFLDSFEPGPEAAKAAHAYLLENYRQYPILYADAYREIFRRLLTGHKVIVHCTAGKDRAGTAAAIVLSALGVPRETVFEDYALTNRYWERGNRVRPGMDAETAAHIFSAREEYLTAAFATIENDFGGVESYLADHLGLDPESRAALHRICLD